jgi:hypothetical protein
MSDAAASRPGPAPSAQDIAETLDQHLFGGVGDSLDIVKMARLISGYESAQYYIRHMGGARTFNAPKPLYDHALSIRQIEGLVLEFGVASGRTLAQISAGVNGAKVYGFDGFKGLPENWKFGRGQGAFARTDLPPVPANAELVIGWFADTLPGFVAQHQDPVSFLHVDCDLYSSTVDILTNLRPHIAPGTVIVFNEYYNYPGWQQHEIKAWHEFVRETGTRYRYVNCNRRHQQVTVIVEEAPAFGFANKLRRLPNAPAPDA